MIIDKAEPHPFPDILLVLAEFSVQVLAAVNTDGVNSFDDVRGVLVAQNLTDTKANPLTAERLPDGVIHQVCMDNNIDVSA